MANYEHAVHLTPIRTLRTIPVIVSWHKRYAAAKHSTNPIATAVPTTNEPWSLHDQGSRKTIVAVAAGFEPAVAINHTAFRVLHLRPLGHATADYRSGITPHSATRHPVGRDTSPDCTSIVEPMPGSARPKRASNRHAAYSPHAADVVPAFRASPRRRRPAYAEPSRQDPYAKLFEESAPRARRAVPFAATVVGLRDPGPPRTQSRPASRPTRTPAETQTAPESVRRRRQTPWPTAASAQSQQIFHRLEEI